MGGHLGPRRTSRPPLVVRPAGHEWAGWSLAPPETVCGRLAPVRRVNHDLCSLEKSAGACYVSRGTNGAQLRAVLCYGQAAAQSRSAIVCLQRLSVVRARRTLSGRFSLCVSASLRATQPLEQTGNQRAPLNCPSANGAQFNRAWTLGPFGLRALPEGACPCLCVCLASSRECAAKETN